ncbi:hypothetical protein GCM10007940_06060 [Portibacter lacus]|uniref:Uncharacterized protein n=1 Tax=Portibacter lacus TaxID=1099794 RepID=A0AA37SJY6_9BACT|nr:hypothetical protein GCM10007940_06060 [Portibacter lacus]
MVIDQCLSVVVHFNIASYHGKFYRLAFKAKYIGVRYEVNKYKGNKKLGMIYIKLWVYK